MTQENQNYFAKLSAINVSEHIEKKGQFSYLSWPFAVQQLRNFDEKATWAVMRFDGLPYQKTELGVFVEVSVTVQNVTLSQIHPVLDSKNRPLMEPSAFDINTSIQRCLVKAIALHGLGLNVYAGEDLPQGESNGETTKPLATVKPPHRSTPKGEVVLLTEKQLGYINKLVAESKTDVQQLLGFFGFDSLEHIPKSEVNRVIRVLENNRQKEAA
jgi:hypothetical protein